MLSFAENLTVLAVVIASIAIVFTRRVIKSKFNSPLPPGPKGWPLVGNIDLPMEYFWLRYSELGKSYGDIAMVTVFGRRIIILNKHQDCVEMLEKHQQNYNTRPKMEMVMTLAGWDQMTVALPINEQWKNQRRILHKLMGTRTAVQKFHDIQLSETRKFMREVIHASSWELGDRIHHWAGAMILKIVYGYDVKPGSDHLVEIVDKTMANFNRISRPGAYLCNYLTLMRFIPSWFPGGGFKNEAKGYRKTHMDMINTPFTLVQDQIKAGTAPPSYVHNVLSADDYTADQEYNVKISAASAYVGAVDTTSAQVHGFFLIMLIWQDKQKKAQEEIDRVVGTDRLPQFSDREQLPYLEALLTECMRLHTAVPFGGPRSALEDELLAGYRIPKDAMIVANMWQFLHDPEVYESPLDFKPERWLVESPPTNPREIIFGFGRRICPGMMMADASIYIVCATVLALFEIRPIDGSPTSFTHGPGGVLDGHSVCAPKPFRCRIVPRSGKVEALIANNEDEIHS